MVRRTKRSGATIIESVVATVIIAIGVMGSLNMFWVAGNGTTDTANLSTAYAAARNAIEQVHLQGFVNATEGTTTTYYATDGSGPFTSQGTNRFKVVVTITSDKTTVSGGVTSPASDALRSVKVVVTDLSTNNTVFTTGTTLARGGL